MQPPADASDLDHDPTSSSASSSGSASSEGAVGGPLVPSPREEPSPVPAPAALTEREEQIIVFERKWWKHAGSKEQAVRDTFGLSSTRYYQLLNGLLDNPAAMEQDPVLISRLRRLRSTRARTRRR